ncbi:MAG: VOC family protein [Chloroflexi bacterium]|nr:VOC family protein [Chloroflexota bacterium]
MAVKPIPDGYRIVTPYLIVDGVAELLDFLAKAFDAKEHLRLHRPDGSVMHAEVRIDDSVVMLGEPMGEFGPMPASIYLYVNDCDAVYRRALQAGGKSVMEPADQFTDRYGGVKDPSGNIWWVATHIQDLTPEELARRVESLKQQWPQG